MLHQLTHNCTSSRTLTAGHATCLTRIPVRSLLSLQAIMVRTEAQHIKFVVELYDKCHETCQQYIEFLQVGLQLPK